MSSTLISFVGTGLVKNNNGYETTTYVFPNKAEIQDHLFFRAVLTSGYRVIDKVILVGTRTSGWDTLVNLEDSQAESLWEKLGEERGTEQGVSDETIASLREYLSKSFGVPVVICVHTPHIDETTVAQVFEKYNSLVPEISSDSDILFDITHGFRSMPLLLYQALQYAIVNDSTSRTIEIVYGEFISRENRIAQVRNLSKYWELSQATDALDVFTTKLDGTRLAALVKPYWPQGSRVILRLSNIVQTNFALQITETLRNLRNVLAEVVPVEKAQWLTGVRDQLQSMLELLDDTSQAKTLYNYARFLFEKKLNTQAIITLQVAVETAIAEQFGDDSCIGDYEWWQETGKHKLRNISREERVMREGLRNLEHMRNQIAHAGARSRNMGGFPAAENIPAVYKSGLRAVELLLAALDSMKQ